MSTTTPAPQRARFWDEHRLGIAVMDGHHACLAATIAELTTATDDAFKACFARLHEQTRKRCDDEQALMQDSGFSHYAATRTNTGASWPSWSSSSVAPNAVSSRSRAPIAYVRDRLSGWFPLHLITTDAALAAHLGVHTLPNKA